MKIVRPVLRNGAFAPTFVAELPDGYNHPGLKLRAFGTHVIFVTCPDQPTLVIDTRTGEVMPLVPMTRGRGCDTTLASTAAKPLDVRDFGAIPD